MSRRIVIEFLGQDKSLGKTVADVEKKTSTFGDKMQRAGSIAGKALAGGAIIAAGGLYKMTQSASEDEAAQSKLSNALKQSAGATDAQVASVEDWITAQGKALGVTDDELRPALGRLADATGSVSEAQKLTSLAMDVSAGTGKDLSSVIEAMVKAQNGSVGGLGRLGVATKNAEGKTKSFKAIQEDLAKHFEGRAAKAADTTAGKQKILTTQLGELGEQIGAKVLPALVKLSEIGIKMVAWVSKNTTTVGVLVGVLAGLAAVVWAVGAAIKVWSAITKVAAAVQWVLNAAMSANPIGLVVIAIAALVAGLIIAYKKSETFRKIVNGAFGAVKKFVVGTWHAIQAAAKFVWDWLKKNWPYLLGILTGPFGIAAALIYKNWDKIKTGAKVVKDYVADKFNALVGFFKGIPDRITHAASGMWDGIKNAFKTAINWIIGAWNGLDFSIPGFSFHGVGFPGVTIGTPDIPLLAKGGIATRPTLAMIGEAGPEAVIPLSGRGRAGMGTTINITVQSLDPRESGRLVVQALSKWQRSTGQVLPVRAL